MTPRARRWLLVAVPAAVLLTAAAAVHYADADRSASPGSGSRSAIISAPPEVGLAVYPTADSRTASPRTSISLRGLDPAAIGRISVHGSQTGSHPGRFRADSDGKGESFYPDRPFAPGERVTVTAHRRLVGSTARNRDQITFTVSRPVADPVTRTASPEYNNPANEHHYVTAPQLNAPVIRVVKGSLSASAGDLFLDPRGGSGGDGPMIAKPDGTLVWYKTFPAGYQIYDFRAQTYQGHPVLTWYQGFPADMHGRGVDVIYDSSYHQIATVRAGNGYAADHHDFQLTRWNTALITSYQPVHWDLRSVGGRADGIVTDSIFQEIDIPTGNVLAEWHTLDHVALSDSFRSLPKQPQRQWDYFHINSVDSRQPGNVLVSSRMTHTIYDVDESSGQVLWRLGGKHSSFTGNANDFSSQHDAKFLDATHISVFDNGGGVGPTLHQHSRAVVVKFDFAAGKATLVTNDQDSDFLFAPTQGSTEVLPNGNVFVGWAGQRFASEFDRTGKEIYRSVVPDHNESYREYLLPWRGSPTTVPSVAASIHGSATTVWASWNGATEVAAWRVLTGSSPSSLIARAGTYRSSGFETAMTVRSRPAYVAVQALRADGSVLATSRPAAVARH